LILAFHATGRRTARGEAATRQIRPSTLQLDAQSPKIQAADSPSCCTLGGHSGATATCSAKK
jgi:hypothetical protein